MTAILRAKMQVEEVTHRLNEKGETESEIVKLRAVYGEEGPNAEWSKWTPSAHFEIHINNPNAFKQLSNGHEFYIDFIPVE